MKILMITEKDAANSSLGKIADAFLRRGHNVVIYAPYYKESVLYMFDKSIEKYPFEELDDEAVYECDIIFMAAVSATFLSRKNILSVKKPIFTHNYLIDKQISWGGDISFVPSHSTVESEYDEVLQYTRFAIGEPKYDIVTEEKEYPKRFLFIDSGHYPFGYEGKKELAKTLLRICEVFPDYEMMIKPRFLPGDKVITHRNTLTIYDVIREETDGKIPENMVMLVEHRDLAELIDVCRTVICMYTTAFVGAYAAGKGLVVLDGLPSEDVYDVRMKTFHRIRENMMRSGALIPYQNAEKLLPEGVRCTEEYRHFLLEETENVADKICESVEFLFEKFYSNNLFPQIMNCTYKDFRHRVHADSSMSWEELITIRYRNYLFQRMLIHIDFHINTSLDIHRIKEFVNKLGNHIDKEHFNVGLRKVNQVRSECIVDNYESMLKNDIDAGILLNAFYLLRNYDAIREFPQKEIGAYYLFNGFVQYEVEKDISSAIVSLKKYFELTNDRQYIKEISDMSNNRFKAFAILTYLLYQENNISEAREYLAELKHFYMSIYFLDCFDEKIVDKVQGQQYTYIYWLHGMINHLDEDILENVDNVLVYGAGVLARNVVMKQEKMKNKICAFIDNYTNQKDVGGIRVIKNEELKQYENVKTIIVTVPHQYERIRKTLIEISAEYTVISINGLF